MMGTKYLIVSIKSSLLLLFLLFAGNSLMAQNLQISGGFRYSVSLCSNGKIYAWGGNNSGQLGRNPSTGTPYAVASSTVPLEVQLPVGLTMQKVDAGSGGTAITLACDGSVWTWGENCNGAIGNGLVGACPVTPVDGNGYYSALQRVVGGAQGGAFLTGVGYINASTTSSFAVETATGRVLAWGNNSNGELGQGTNTNVGNTYAPRYVLTAAGTPLTGIISVEGSDYGGYALGSDGFVYSWGGNTNNDLGRVIAGDQFYAKRVKAYNYTTGTTTGDLSNIKKITGGDTHGLAIDGDGNLWSWGGDWGPGQRGWGATGASQPYATRVVAVGTPCAYEQWKFGPWLTDVIEISAGQQHSIALLSTGKVVTFGSDASGQLGDGGLGGSSGCPVYVKTAAATDLTGVVAISDGDLWSFAINSAGGVYVWGENTSGELGINGNTTDQGFATLNPAIPTTCGGSLLPCPIAYLGADILKCPNASVTLLAGANGDTYLYTWYYGASATGPWTQIGALNQTYPTGASLAITTPRFYRVVTRDSRATVADKCGPCPATEDVVQVTDRTPPVATTSAGSCGTQACFDIASTGAIDNTAFDWYAVQTGGIKLNASPTDPFCTEKSNLTLNGTNYEIWVDDRRTFASSVGPVTDPCAPTGGAVGKYQQQFVIYRDVVITSVDVYYRTYSVSAANDAAIVRVYNNDPNKNSTSTDGVNVLTGQVSTTVSIPRTSTTFTKITLSGLNLALTGSPGGSKYWLELSGLTDGVFGEFTCAAAYPYSDAVVGEDVVVLRGSTTSAQAIQQANYNAMGINWRFTYMSAYPCGRFKLSAPDGVTSCPLPVEFLSFDVINSGSTNILSWTTAWEENSDYFEVLRSIDGQNYISVGRVEAAGNSSSLSNYSFTDDGLSAGTYYYKIKQVDFDGKSSFSDVEVVSFDNAGSIDVVPTAVAGGDPVRVINFSGEELVNISVIDMTGKVYVEYNHVSDSVKDIETTGLAAGVYLVKVVAGDQVVTKKVLVY